MGNRGPQPKGEYGGTSERTAVFSTRLRQLDDGLWRRQKRVEGV